MTDDIPTFWNSCQIWLKTFWNSCHDITIARQTDSKKSTN